MTLDLKEMSSKMLPIDVPLPKGSILKSSGACAMWTFSATAHCNLAPWASGCHEVEAVHVVNKTWAMHAASALLDRHMVLASHNGCESETESMATAVHVSGLVNPSQPPRKNKKSDIGET